MSESAAPPFEGSANVAMKVPAHTYEQTVTFYEDTLGLPILQTDESSCSFQFGPLRLWIDRVPQYTQPELWLEVRTHHTETAWSHLEESGVPRRDQVEALPEGFDGFWIANPAGVIHLVSRHGEWTEGQKVRPA